MTECRKWNVEHLQTLLDVLNAQGYCIYGPQLRSDAVVYGEIDAIEQLPAGWHDQQSAGSYRMDSDGDPQLFGYALGPQSWRKYLQPPRERLWSAKTNTDTQAITVSESKPAGKKMAFLGIRACEVHAIDIQDDVFLNGTIQDNRYAARRENLFLVAVNCGHVVSTCFCTSMGEGPKVDAGFDLCLTEVYKNGEHFFAVAAASDCGRSVLQVCGSAKLSESDKRLVTKVERDARLAVEQNVQLNTEGIEQLFYNASDSEYWQELADRCLSCANCTMVCPSCFCSNTTDSGDVSGRKFERWQQWDSCFSADFSYLHGGSVRASTASRYRQWLSHKLASWQQQFGRSGCVGCGRCVSWCPVGIDLRAEVQALRLRSHNADD